MDHSDRGGTTMGKGDHRKPHKEAKKPKKEKAKAPSAANSRGTVQQADAKKK
jgi:hypothetical protein